MQETRSPIDRVRAWAAAAALLCAGLAGAQALESVTTFANGPGNGRYAFPTWTPKSVGELFRGATGAPTVDIVGQLFLPAGTAKVPAVVLMHGSGGVYDALLDYWPKQFNAAGIAAFTLDRFGPRGVRSTTADQSRVPLAADVADAFAALRLLATHPRIDRQRIALMGFSRGGTATLRAAVEWFVSTQNLPDGLRYAAFIPTYSGGCVGLSRLLIKPGVFGGAPMLFIHGSADDYTPIAPCRDYADRIGKAGTPVEFVVIDGAHHKFDADDTRRHVVRDAQRTRPECPIEIDIDTLYAYDRNSGARLQGATYEEAAKGCGARGASVEGNAAARDRAAQAAVAFLTKVFAR
jgi:dienelactone hydrolase